MVQWAGLERGIRRPLRGCLPMGAGAPRVQVLGNAVLYEANLIFRDAPDRVRRHEARPILLMPASCVSRCVKMVRHFHA